MTMGGALLVVAALYAGFRSISALSRKRRRYAPAAGQVLQKAGPGVSGEPVPVSARLRIRYVDSYGGKTLREIHIHSFDAPTGIVTAYCSLRHDLRTFYVDRMKNAVDLDSGELVPDMRRFLDEKAQSWNGETVSPS
jgi:hypothetical protein